MSLLRPGVIKQHKPNPTLMEWSLSHCLDVEIPHEVRRWNDWKCLCCSDGDGVASSVSELNRSLSNFGSGVDDNLSTLVKSIQKVNTLCLVHTQYNHFVNWKKKKSKALNHLVPHSVRIVFNIDALGTVKTYRCKPLFKKPFLRALRCLKGGGQCCFLPSRLCQSLYIVFNQNLSVHCIVCSVHGTFVLWCVSNTQPFGGSIQCRIFNILEPHSVSNCSQFEPLC